ncbi:TTC28 [Branchiostoma lanceolatum]|uniref:TTC28 protein n=1 Tax=Branchiostoma lanceolatum TaxID=7740 RepID=A0A8K0EGN7_BRALA|nr:TTC28 [Branchiostoma lanceolatum]
MADHPRQDLYLEIDRNLKERELIDLRNYVSGAKILPARFVQKADAQQIFNQLEHERKLKDGDISLLGDILRKIGRHDYAEQAEEIAENERKELICSLQHHDKNLAGWKDQTSRKSETVMDFTETGPSTSRDETASQSGPPLLPIVVEILAQVIPSVETPDDMLSYAQAKETLCTIDVTADETLHMLKQIKSRTANISELLKVVKAIKKLEKFKGVKVAFVKKGSLVFYLQCTDLNGLGELWFMYKRGELNTLMHISMVSEETVQQLSAATVSVKTTINVEDFSDALVYTLTSPSAKGQSVQRLSQEYPLYQPHTHTRSNVLDVLHLDRKKLPKVCGEQPLQERPLPTQRDDGEDDLRRLGNFQTADDQQTAEALGNTEVPQMASELVSLDIDEWERLLGPRRKRTSSMGSESSGYVTGTPGSGLSRPDSPTGNGDTQSTLETLLAELNTPAVKRDKAQQFDLYCQIGDLYRTKLHNLQSALQYYQNMLECSRALSEETIQAKAYSRLGLTCDMLGLQQEAFRNHERALAIYRVETKNESDICVAYKNLASSLALSGQVSDAKTNYELALTIAMGTGNKIEQIEIYCLLGDLHRAQLREPQVSLKFYYREMLELGRGLGRKDMEGLAYNRLGTACGDMQEYEVALEWHQKHLKMCQDDEDKKEQIKAQINVGTAYRKLGKLDQATSHFNTALQTAQQTGDQHGQMKVYFNMGDMHREQLHSPQTAIQYYEQALDLARQLKDRREEGRAYNRLGLVYCEMGEYEAALGWSKKFLKVSQDYEDTEGQIRAHTEIGDVYRFLDELGEATSHFNTALQMAQQTGNQHGQMNVYLKMGDMDWEQLHSAQTAIQYYKQSLDLARQLKARREEGLAYNRLGQVHYGMGEYEAALRWEEKFLKVSQDYKDTEGQIRAHTNIGGGYSLLGKLDQATSHFNTALQMAQQTGDQHGQIEVYAKMGEMHREQLHSPRTMRTAIQYYKQSLDLARQLKDRREEGLAYNRLGQVHCEMGEYEAALGWSEKFLKISQDYEDTEGQINAHTDIGDTYRLLGKLDQATSHFNTALQMAQQTGDQHGQIEVYAKMGEMHREQLHSPRTMRTAIQYYKQSLDLARQLKDRREVGLAYNRLGLVHCEMGEYEAALGWSEKSLKVSQDYEDTEGQITAHTNMGDIHKLLEKFDQATSHFNSALQMAQQTGDQREQMKVYFSMGDMHREQLHSPREAIQYYEQALDLGRQLNSKREKELAYDRLGLSHFNIGEYEAGLEWYQKALKIKENGDRGAQGTTHSGAYPTSASPYQDKLGRTSMMKRQMKMCFQTGENHREQLHSPRKAIQFYEHALELARQLKDRHEEGLASDRLGRVYFELKVYEAALEWYEKYLKMKEDDKDKKAQITAHKNIAKSYKKMGKKDLAKSHYQSAMTIAMEIGDKQQRDDIRKKIGKL